MKTAHTIKEGIVPITLTSVRRIGLAALAAALAASVAQPASAQRPIMTQQSLLDRAQIEDLIISYYYNLGAGDAEAMRSYYTEDAVFDVNGLVAKGPAAIEALYGRIREGSTIGRSGTFHMLLSNPLITVNGDSATARLIWTGVMNDTVKGPPRLQEQGREYDVLVKRGGRWLIAKRTVIADSGMPNLYDQTYAPRKDYDPLK